MPQPPRVAKGEVAPEAAPRKIPVERTVTTEIGAVRVGQAIHSFECDDIVINQREWAAIDRAGNCRSSRPVRNQVTQILSEHGPRVAASSKQPDHVAVRDELAVLRDEIGAVRNLLLSWCETIERLTTNDEAQATNATVQAFNLILDRVRDPTLRQFCTHRLKLDDLASKLFVLNVAAQEADVHVPRGRPAHTENMLLTYKLARLYPKKISGERQKHEPGRRDPCTRWIAAAVKHLPPSANPPSIDQIAGHIRNNIKALRRNRFRGSRF